MRSLAREEIRLGRELSKARHDRGILLASGLIAGGALAGVFDGFTKMICGYMGWKIREAGLTESTQNWIGMAVFLVLACLLYLDARRAKAQ